MSQLALYLLGLPGVELNGVPLQIERRKALALLIYLTVTPNLTAGMPWQPYSGRVMIKLMLGPICAGPCLRSTKPWIRIGWRLSARVSLCRKVTLRHFPLRESQDKLCG